MNLKDIKQEIERNNPLILNLTNVVSMEFIANALLAIGASPVMSQDTSDALELLKHSQAININIGTLDSIFIERALNVAQYNNKIKPCILDPVGSGASHLRTETSTNLLNFCTSLRGNASEIKSLINISEIPKGVDAQHSTLNSITEAKLLSKNYNIPVAISGDVDFIISDKKNISCSFGHEWMSKITGMGCVLTSIIAVFNTIILDPFEASFQAHVFYGLCGEQAFENSSSFGDFKNRFFDALYQPNFDNMFTKIKKSSKLKE